MANAHSNFMLRITLLSGLFYQQKTFRFVFVCVCLRCDLDLDFDHVDVSNEMPRKYSKQYQKCSGFVKILGQFFGQLFRENKKRRMVVDSLLEL